MTSPQAPDRARRWRRRSFAIGAVVTVFGLGVAAPSAWAACEGEPPTPQEPDSGMAGWLVDPVKVDLPGGDASDLAEAINNQPDPFTDDDVGLIETYGYGYNWGTYDLGCGPNAVKDPISIAFSSIGNFVFDAGLTMGAAAQTAQSYVFNSPLDFLNGTVSETQDAVLTSIWQVWFPVTLMGVGIYLLARARRAELSSTAQASLFVVTVLAASVYFLNWPIKAIEASDSVVSEGIQIATSPFGSEPIHEQMASTIYYPAWLRGELGSDTSAVAQEYGPQLFKAQHYSWTEIAVLNAAKPVDREVLRSAKGDEFEAIANEIREQYPTAYEHLIGRSGENRLGTAFLVLPFSAASALFVCVCMGLLLLALMIIRGFILAFPIVGLIGAHPVGRPALSRLWDLLTAAVWNVFKFAFTIGLFLVIAGALLSADISALAKIFFLIVLTAAVFAIARPFRAAKMMIPGVDPNKSYLRSGWQRFRGRDREAERLDDEQRERDKIRSDTTPGQERSPDRSRSEEESLPPLATPTTASAAGYGPPGPNGDYAYRPGEEPPPGAYANGATPPPYAGASPWPGSAGPSGVYADGVHSNGNGSATPSGTGYPGSRLPLETIEQRTIIGGANGYPGVNGNGQSTNGRRPGYPATDGYGFAAIPSGRHARRDDTDHAEAIPTGYPTPAPERVLTEGSRTPEPSMPPPPRRVAIEGEAVEPVYRRGYDTAPEPVADIPMSEPVIDEEGNQLYVIYQRGPRGRVAS